MSRPKFTPRQVDAIIAGLRMLQYHEHREDITTMDFEQLEAAAAIAHEHKLLTAKQIDALIDQVQQ